MPFPLKHDPFLGVQPPPATSIAKFEIEERPHLIVIVDAEEEFDWNAPFSRGATSTRSIGRQHLTQNIFDSFGVVPIYAIDYPVASQAQAYEPLREFMIDGRCSIAAHLHPWVNPPFLEEVNERNSYPGNLPGFLEKEKLARLKERLEDSFGISPTVYRAGRYGLGVHTAESLSELGFKIDCSVLPRVDVRPKQGPDYRNFSAQPYWFGRNLQLLELPTTVGLVGLLKAWAPKIYSMASMNSLSQLKLPGMLSRLRLTERIQLTPEGTTLEEAKRLTTKLIAHNQRIFVLTFHSTSLLPGSNPYVQDESDLETFLKWLNDFLDYFFNRLNGIASNPFYLLQKAHRAETAAALVNDRGYSTIIPELRTRSGAVPVSPAGSKAGFKCLLVASTFPPLVGGTCVVYHNLCKYGNGKVIPLVPYLNFATGKRIEGEREYDRSSPYRIYRRRLLRPEHRWDQASRLLRFGRAVLDLGLLTRVLVNVISIVYRERINIFCCGELTYCGWLVVPCKYLLGLKTIIYVHGEEITTSGDCFVERVKFKWLRMADAVVAVSRFTARQMIERAGVAPERIHLITNGVDTDVFRPMVPSEDLIERYNLQGKRVILSVGRLVERKGIDHVLRAFPTVLSRNPDAHYLVVGDGAYRSRLEEIAESLSITEHVSFVGEVASEDLVEHYSLAEIFIQANRDLADGDTEGFGLVFLEANACGKPVIAGRAGGAPDAVTHGENGLLVDGYDIEAIARAIDTLLADGQLREKLRERALARAMASSWKDRVSEFCALCMSLALKSRSGMRPADQIARDAGESRRTGSAN